MFDIFIITFAAELPNLKLQARSINKYLHNFPVGNIYIVDNDWLKDIKPQIENLRHEFGQFADKVHVIKYKEMYDGPVSEGYIRQQILKLYAHRVCQSTNIMILDSKNFFIDDVCHSDFEMNGKLRAVYDKTSDYWKSSRDYAWMFFGLQPEKEIKIRTPFLIRWQTLVDLENDLKLRYEREPADFFGDRGTSSTNEFNLMQAYILKRYGDFNEYYFFTSSHPQWGRFETGMWWSDIVNWQTDTRTGEPRSLEMILTYPFHEGDRIVCTGIHRDVYKMMYHHQIVQLKQFWQDRGLLSQDESDELVSAMIS
jgi:hypothetical protein